MIGWKEMIREDEEAILHRDPAAKSLLEVRLCYPGLKALKAHRRANALGSRAAGPYLKPARPAQDRH